MTLLEDFYQNLGESRKIDDITRAYSAVNSISLADAVSGNTIRAEEYIEIFEDYQKNLKQIAGLPEALENKWGGLPRVLRIGQSFYDGKDNEKYLSVYNGLSSSQRRQVKIIYEYCISKEGYRKDFDFYFLDDSERNLMVTDDMADDEKSGEYQSLQAMLIKLLQTGGGASFHWYTGNEENYQKVTACFAARPGCIYRVEAARARSTIANTRNIQNNETFITAPLSLKTRS